LIYHASKQTDSQTNGATNSTSPEVCQTQQTHTGQYFSRRPVTGNL